MICVPITEKRAEEVLAAVDEAASVAEAIELRLDYLDEAELSPLIDRLPAKIAALNRSFILTYRPREEGGARDLTLDERRAFWQSLAPELVAALSFADFELDLVESFGDNPPVPWEKVICSAHDFARTPEDLLALYDRLAATPARAVKIATRAERITDTVRHFQVLDRAREQGRDVIAIGMGLAGIATRILSPAWGAMLTFGALRAGAESAPGQPTISELRDLYRVDQLTRASEVYGVIGNPIGHSRSPQIQNRAIIESGRDAVYLPFEVVDLEEFMRDMVNPRTRKLDWRLRGLSVTIPHKLAIKACLDRIDKTAGHIGAINTVVVEGDELVGYNTDADGAMKPLEEMIEIKGARVAVLGAGGSARAVCYGLHARGAQVTIYARNLERAQELSADYDARVAGMEHFQGGFDVVINCTPVGMRGHSEGMSPIDAEKLEGVDLVYDLVYNPERTALLEAASARGCRTLNGLAMLEAQAGEQIRLWTERE